MWTLLREIASHAAHLNHKVYLVGGSLRDLLRGIMPTDLDLTVASGASVLAQRVAEQHRATVVLLDEQRETLRVVLKDNLHLDFCLFKGTTLEEDLWARDFTINAMALPLQADQPEALVDLIDPTGGRQDLHYGLLRATNHRAMLDDPLRVLRGIRLAAQYHLTIIPETGVLLRQGTRRLASIAGERIWQELSKLLGNSGAYPWVELMDRDLRLWHQLLPGRLRMEETQQNYYHTENVWHHCLRTYRCLEVILQELPLALAEGQAVLAALGQPLSGGNKNRLQVLKLASLLHDVGKPDTAVTQPSGRISFHGHSLAGLPYAHALADILKLSNPERDYLLHLVRYHMQPLHHYTARDHSDLATYRLFRTLGYASLDLLLLSLADLTATLTAGERLSELTPYRSFIHNLIRQYLARYRNWQPTKYLSGADLIKMGILAGPLVGEVLEKLAEAQITGTVKDLQTAQEWVKEHVTT
ncbi:CCA tRNA nucleotidyltransferase [Desulforamulus aeronauticus]|nr:HD domain-containing protein [Desulforamulus aeronauticus]